MFNQIKENFYTLRQIGSKTWKYCVELKMHVEMYTRTSENAHTHTRIRGQIPTVALCERDDASKFYSYKFVCQFSRHIIFGILGEKNNGCGFVSLISASLDRRDTYTHNHAHAQLKHTHTNAYARAHKNKSCTKY